MDSSTTTPHLPQAHELQLVHLQGQPPVLDNNILSMFAVILAISVLSGIK